MNKVGRKPKTENINIDILNEWLQNDVNRIAAIKCQSIISLKNGVSVNDVCKVLNVNRESVRLWRRLIEKEGPNGFISHPKTGRKSGLTQEIKDLLKEAINKPPTEFGFHQVIWNGKLVCKYLENEKNVHISVRTAQNWLKIIGFTRQIPRKQYSQTNEIENEAFKKKIIEESLQLNENVVIVFSDEAGIKLDADLKKIYAIKGQQPQIITHSPYGKVNLTGYVNPKDGEIFINQMAKGNSENFIKQLEFLKEKYKNKIVRLYVDNARWHKTKAVWAWIEENTTIKLNFLPKYAPKLNPMERHWWNLRRLKTKNKVFGSKEECWNSIQEYANEITIDEIIRICQF